jgi:tetratricopeptide (TPR) repeat protein
MMGHILISLQNYSSAEDYLQRAAQIGRALDLRRLYGVSLLHLGWLMRKQNQLEAAYSYLEEGVQVVRSVGIVRQITSGLSEQGYTLLRMGNPLAALARLQEGLQLAREAGHALFICTLQGYLSVTHLALNDADAARCALREMFALVQNLDSRPQKVEAISIAVAYYQHLGLNQQAAVWTGTIIGDPHLDEYFDLPIYSKLEAALGSKAYQRALDRGKTRSVDEVVVQIMNLLDNSAGL